MGREIERGKKELEEEMRKEQGGMMRALSMKLHRWWLWEALWAALCLPLGEHLLIYV
jgi:hypothetical protein